MHNVGFLRETLPKCLSLLAVLFVLSGCLSKMEEITEATRETVRDSNDLMSDLQKGQQIMDSISQLSEPDDNLRVAALQRLLKLYEDESRLAVLFGMMAPLKYGSIELPFIRSVDYEDAYAVLPNVVLVERPRRVLLQAGGVAITSEVGESVVTAADLLEANPVSRDFYSAALRTAGRYFHMYADAAHRGGLEAKDREDLKKLAPRVLRLGTAIFGAAYVDDAHAYAEQIADKKEAKLERILPILYRERMAKGMLDFIFRLGIKDAGLEAQTRDFIRERMEVDLERLKTL